PDTLMAVLALLEGLGPEARVPLFGALGGTLKNARTPEAHDRAVANAWRMIDLLRRMGPDEVAQIRRQVLPPYTLVTQHLLSEGAVARADTVVQRMPDDLAAISTQERTRFVDAVAKLVGRHR